VESLFLLVGRQPVLCASLQHPQNVIGFMEMDIRNKQRFEHKAMQPRLQTDACCPACVSIA